jgi:hypothetical protein
MDGGRDPYLSPLDLGKFREIVLERAADLNCITRRDTLLLACDLSLRRRRIARMLLETARLRIPEDLLDVTPPSPEWVNQIGAELELKICAPQEIDAARRHFCDHDSITFFL